MRSSIIRSVARVTLVVIAFFATATAARAEPPSLLEAIVKRWLQRDAALKTFVDNWIKQARDDGRFAKTYSMWFE